MKTSFEVVILPVSDADRSLRFYRDQLGFKLDVNYAPSPDFRVVQLTHESHSSIQFSVGLTDAVPGSVRDLYPVVRDIEACQRGPRDRGLGVNEIRHKDTDGGWRDGYPPGLDPGRSDYASFADFRDPDGNAWLLQERGYHSRRHASTTIGKRRTAARH